MEVKVIRQTEHIHAVCEDCNKGYRVPIAGRIYTCKSCGGSIQVAAQAHVPQAVLERFPTCSRCHAVSIRGAEVCDECGADLATSPAAIKSEPDLVAQREVTSALKHGYKWIAGVTLLYRMGAIAYGVVTLFAVLALADPMVPQGPGILVVALFTLLTMLMIAGAIQVVFRPFVWTLVTASLASIASVTHLLGPNPLGLAFIWSACWAGVFWLALSPTLRFRRLIADHKDQYITHYASLRTQRSLRRRSTENRHDRLMAVLHGASRRAWNISVVAGACICLASALGTYRVVSSLRPQGFSLALESFETAWNESDLAAVGSFLPSSIRERKSLWLAGMAEGHGFGASWPQLDGGQHREGVDRIWADYELADLTLSTCWALDGQRWSLIQIELPTPPLEPAIDSFRRAWNNSDAEAIAAFFPPDYRERMRESIESSALRRDWIRFPKILATDISAPPEGEVVVTMTVGDGEVTTKWLFRSDGRWGLQALKLPKS